MNPWRAVGDLFIIAWPILPPDAFIGTQKQIDDFTFKLTESKIQELNSISTTVSWLNTGFHSVQADKYKSALIAGVVATLYSWPSFDKSPWPAHVLIGASFILSLLSVRKALQLSFILRRLELHGGDDRTAAGNKIRRQLATLEGEDWVPSRGHEILWNSPVLYLNLATISLLLGYAWGIFAAAVEVGFDTGKRETKVALLAPVSRPIF
jgi:hypothetical protein